MAFCVGNVVKNQKTYYLLSMKSAKVVKKGEIFQCQIEEHKRKVSHYGIQLQFDRNERKS